jgi:hypothetical protein
VFKTTTENQKRWEANEEIDCWKIWYSKP